MTATDYLARLAANLLHLVIIERRTLQRPFRLRSPMGRSCCCRRTHVLRLRDVCGDAAATQSYNRKIHEVRQQIGWQVEVADVLERSGSALDSE